MLARSSNPALAQVVDGDADVVQRDAGVEQPLDDLEDQDVLERVQPLAARAGRAADGRHDEGGARPVVQLAVGDAGDLAGARPAVADELVGHRVVGEQTGLHGFAGRAGGGFGGRATRRTDPTAPDVACRPLSILSPIELASCVATCTAAHVCPSPNVSSIRFPPSRDCPSAIKVWLPDSRFRETRAACRAPKPLRRIRDKAPSPAAALRWP